VAAARARVTPAGLRPDPMLMAGVQNFPVSEPGFGDFMTMKMVGVGQSIPYPGKLGLRRRAAALEVGAAQAAAGAAARQVEREVRGAYYELAFLDQALGIAGRNHRVLAEFVRVAEARYSAGQVGQPGGGLQDVLRARVEATRLAEQAVALSEQRRAALARLNAALDRPTDTPVAEPRVPARVARAAVADSAGRVRFASAALGARAADSPLPSLAALQETAVRESPELREHEAMIAAQAARAELARREHLPDVDVSLQYGQRRGLSDMVTATVSVPLPVQKRSRQDLAAAEARSEFAALEAEHDARRNALRADVARLASETERQRAQLALYVKAILPQGRAALTAATTSYQVGRAEFLTVLDNQATLFNYETEYVRTLSDFATTLAELERVVGQEVLP
jgi:outer membrane protein TolC